MQTNGHLVGSTSRVSGPRVDSRLLGLLARNGVVWHLVGSRPNVPQPPVALIRHFSRT